QLVAETRKLPDDRTLRVSEDAWTPQAGGWRPTRRHLTWTDGTHSGFRTFDAADWRPFRVPEKTGKQASDVVSIDYRVTDAASANHPEAIDRITFRDGTFLEYRAERHGVRHWTLFDSYTKMSARTDWLPIDDHNSVVQILIQKRGHNQATWRVIGEAPHDVPVPREGTVRLASRNQ